MSADLHVQAEDGHGHRFLAHHFANIENQSHAARLGMWLFLGTEILLFGALFLGYSVYRHLYPLGFKAASGLLSKQMGLLDTFILITSSMTMALGLHYGQMGEKKRKLATFWLVITILFGAGFLVAHSIEYYHDYLEGALPGKYYHVEHAMVPGASLFYMLYFIMTGLHSFHVIVGAAVLVWVTVRTIKGHFDSKYYTPLELGGMYWHLVDLIWIFLFPLLYLI